MEIESEKYYFKGEIKRNKDKDAAYIEVPIDIEKKFGVKRLKVKAKFDSEEYRGSIVKMGFPCYIIGITKDIRNKIGKSFGDIVEVEFCRDEEERIINIPQEFREKLLACEEAKGFFDSLSYSNKKNYINFITSAKKEETRLKREEETIKKLIEKIKL